MFTIQLLEDAGSSSGMIWIPVLVLGWFLAMTVVGWQVSHRNTTAGNHPQDAEPSHSESNPSETDNH